MLIPYKVIASSNHVHMFYASCLLALPPIVSFRFLYYLGCPAIIHDSHGLLACIGFQFGFWVHLVCFVHYCIAKCHT